MAAIVPLDDLEAMQALEDAMDVKAARDKPARRRGARRHAEAFFRKLMSEET